MEPYSRFARHINAYAIPMASNEAGVSDKYGDKVDTYFGLMADGKTMKFQDQSYVDRVTDIRSWVEAHYLDEKAAVNTMHFLINTSAAIGSSSGVMYSFSSLSADSGNGSVMAHEIAHSLGDLGDEYGYDTNAANLSNTDDPNQIKWKGLLGFRSIRIVPGNAEGRWIPTNRQCNMYALGEPFCEVCRLQYIRRLHDKVTDGPDLYVAQPEVTTEHKNTVDSADYRITQENLLQKAQDATLELRTVVQNLTDAPRTIRLHLAITAADGTVKEEKQQDFALSALENSYNMEQACIYPSVKMELWSDLTDGDRLTGEVLEVLADGGTHLLDTYQGQTYETYTVRYQTEDGQAIPSSFVARIPLAQGTDPRTLAPQMLAGRTLIRTEVSEQTRTITLIYEQREEPDDKFQETVVGYSGQYDGKAHRITVSYPAEAGITAVQYSKDNGRNYEEENPAFKDVTNGKQTVWYRLLRGSAVVAEGSATVEITPCDNPVTLTASPSSLRNGGTVTLTAAIRSDADDGSIRLGAVRCDQSDIQPQESGAGVFTVQIPASPSKDYTFTLEAEGDWMRNSKNPIVQAVVSNTYQAPSQGGGGGGGGGGGSSSGSGIPAQGGGTSSGSHTTAQGGGSASVSAEKTGAEKTGAEKTEEGKAGETKPNEKRMIKMQVGNRTVTVDEKTVSADVAPVIRNNRTLVPIRMITETLGGRVSWNAQAKEVVLTIDGKEIKMTIGKPLAAYGVAPVIMDGRTFVPVRFVADELGAEVQWDSAGKTVTILADGKSSN